jgi:hypothetical protein
MKYVLLIALLFPPLAGAGVFSTEDVKPYPPGWPVLAGMSGTCAEVQGSFVDPNARRWEYEEFPTRELGTKQGGSYDAAWLALGLPGQEVLPDKKAALPRVFTIALGADQSVSIKYLLDGEVVSSRTFAKGQWSCGSDGLTLTLLERTGQVLDKLPADGHAVRRATLYKLDGRLYVKTSDHTKAWVIQVIPQSFHSVNWFRFVEQRQLPTAALPVEKILRLNAAKFAFNDKYLQAKGNRAFAQAPGGAWGWASDRTSPRVAAEDAVAACARHLKPHEKACVAVHIDDWWTEAP